VTLKKWRCDTIPVRVLDPPTLCVGKRNDTLTGDHRLEGDGPADRRPQRFGRRVALGRSGSRLLLGIPNALDKV
jgi:hypothetical protein